MQRIAETFGEFLKGDWGRSRLITGGIIDGHYCTLLLLLLKFLADDYSECPMQMQNGLNAPNIVELLSYTLRTPDDVKGFLNFAVQMEEMNELKW